MTNDNYTNSEFYLDVGDGHKLYVHDWGNQAATTPIIFLHGGPGGNCDDKHKALFDGDQQRVIFFDQRGAGQSTPAGLLEKNTTAELVADILKLVQELGLNSVILYGRSWGSCLALNFAIRYPNYVKAIVTGGVFLGTKSEIDYIDNGLFRTHYPHTWETYLEHTPAEYQSDPTAYHAGRILNHDVTAATESALAYANLNGAITRLDDRFTSLTAEDIDLPHLQIEVNYMQHACFMPDNYILANVDKLTMPVWIVQGRYDMLCPPTAAWSLYKALPRGYYVSTVAGHSGSDRANADASSSLLRQLTDA